MITNITQRRRGWLRWLVTAVATAIHPLVGAAVGIAIQNGFLADTDSGRIGDVSDAVGNAVNTTLNTKVIPAINRIAEKLQPIHNAPTISFRSILSTANVLAQLNFLLKDIAILQEYSKYLKTTTSQEDALLAESIDPFLARLNVIVTETLTNNDLQGKIVKTNVSIKVTDFRIVQGWVLNWGRGHILSTYQNIALKSVTAPTTTAVIITPSNDVVLNTVVSATSSDPIIAQAINVATGGYPMDGSGGIGNTGSGVPIQGGLSPNLQPYSGNTGVIPIGYDFPSGEVPVLDAVVVSDYAPLTTPIVQEPHIIQQPTNAPAQTSKKSGYSWFGIAVALGVGVVISKYVKIPKAGK